MFQEHSQCACRPFDSVTSFLGSDLQSSKIQSKDLSMKTFISTFLYLKYKYPTIRKLQINYGSSTMQIIMEPIKITTRADRSIVLRTIHCSKPLTSINSFTRHNNRNGTCELVRCQYSIISILQLRNLKHREVK